MLMYLLVDLACVLDRVYYSHKEKQVNFRAGWKWDVEHERPFWSEHGVQNRLAITEDGSIINREGR